MLIRMQMQFHLTISNCKTHHQISFYTDHFHNFNLAIASNMNIIQVWLATRHCLQQLTVKQVRTPVYNIGVPLCRIFSYIQDQFHHKHPSFVLLSVLLQPIEGTYIPFHIPKERPKCNSLQNQSLEA